MFCVGARVAGLIVALALSALMLAGCVIALGQKLGREGYPWTHIPPEVAVEARR